MYLSLDSILIDELLYPRNELSWRDVQRYIAALQLGAEFPPVVVGKRDHRYVMIDGRHRYEAFRRAKKEKIPALVSKLPEPQWFAEAVRLNVVHGHPLSFQEKIRAAMILKRQSFNVEEIGKIVAVQSEQLEKAINERGHWVHPDDVRPVVVKASIAAKAAKNGREWLEKEAGGIEQKQGTLSGHKIKSLIEELLVLLDGDLVSDVEENMILLTKLRTSIDNWINARITTP